MFLTIETTGTPDSPATDLGFLLHKHPDRAQAFSTSYGTAHVFYPEARAELCRAALLLDVDPALLARHGRGKGAAGRRTRPWRSTSTTVRTRPLRCSRWRSVRSSPAR